MAGTTASGGNRTQPDILFDLTPEDDVKLQESELLQLVNYGQLQKTVKLCGVDGRVYKVEMALLWDEDYIDILRRTSNYANDPLLRIRLMRRLKLHKAIQKIDKRSYEDKEDVVTQRELWLILNRMADKQVEILNALYEQIELERDATMYKAVQQLSDVLNDTMPKDFRKSTETAGGSQTDHEAVFANATNNQKQQVQAIEDTIIGAVEGKKSESPSKDPVAASPKQSL